MNIHEFRLVLADKTDLSLDEANALYKGGCDDATFGGCNGMVYGAFYRQADSLDEALRSAIADANAAGFRVARIEIEADSFLPQQPVQSGTV